MCVQKKNLKENKEIGSEIEIVFIVKNKKNIH